MRGGLLGAGQIGPAFATKFLYFADQGRQISRALILDRLVADWLRGNTALHLNPTAWTVSGYERYLNHMNEWAGELDIQPDAIELAMCQEISERKRNQWSSLVQ